MTSNALSLSCAAVFCGLSLASLAQADVIDEDWEEPQCDPMVCPPGSSPVSLGHSSCPSVCGPSLECETAADCTAYGEGATCIETRFCVQTVYSGHGMSPSVIDACEPSGPCGPTAAPNADEPAECVEARRCFQPNPPPPTAPASGGCAGCAAPGSSPGSSGGGLLIVVGWLVGRAVRR